MSAVLENGTTSPPAKRIKTIPLDDDAETPAAPAAVEEPEATEAPPPTKTTMEASIPLQVKKLTPQGRLPTRGSAFAAGYDLYAARDTVVPARGKVLVDTDISIATPAGTCKSKKQASKHPEKKERKKKKERKTRG
jgi:hypothetical protein